MSRLRKVIATRMLESLAVSAQLTTVLEVDVTRIALLRERVKNEFLAREGVKLTFMPFFAKAACEALKAFPQVNASMDLEAGTVTYHDGEHLGIAVDTERGLLGAGDPQRRRFEHRGSGPQDRRPRRADPHEQGEPRRVVRRHVHDHKHR
ncbi:MAG: 2-oxo acid dehydrogenase subunit E2 [Candidatus Nanopelagicales bacterium]